MKETDEAGMAPERFQNILRDSGISNAEALLRALHLSGKGDPAAENAGPAADGADDQTGNGGKA